RSLSLEEDHDLRGAEAPRTPHREAADDAPALGRIAVERVLQVRWTELAAPPAVFLRQHFVFHGLSTSSDCRKPPRYELTGGRKPERFHDGDIPSGGADTPIGGAE